MDQVTASVETHHYDDQKKLLVTCYTSDCGCRWVVDMWGNVRTIQVCYHCTKEWDDGQFILQLAGSEPQAMPHNQRTPLTLYSPHLD